MVVYFVLTAVGGLLLFEREELIRAADEAAIAIEALAVERGLVARESAEKSKA